jgi:hypothetical protein
MEFIAMNSVNTQPKTTAKAKRAPTPHPRHQERPRFVGIDLHKEIETYHILLYDCKSLKSGSFRVDPGSILEFVSVHLLPTDNLAVKVTSNTWAFVRPVKSHIARIVVSNPMKTKAIAEANIKTDKVDALVLAQLLRCDYLPSVCPPPTLRTNARSPPDDRPWSINAPPSATESNLSWHAGSSSHLREDSLPTKGSPGSSTSTSTHWTEP